MPSNRYGLPQPLVEALTPETHRPAPGRLGVTTLIDSPLKRVLTMQHYDEIEEDVSENIWALFGKMGHRVLEQNKLVSEIRFETEYGGALIVGVVDYANDGTVIDFKFTSIWSAKFASEKPEWEQQLQIYGYFLAKKGIPINSLANWLIMRDWNKMERKRSADYPEIPFTSIDYVPWPNSTVEAFLSERVSLHLSAEKACSGAASHEIPAHFWCTPEERWQRPDTWAVMKAGAERASKVEDTEEAANAWLESKPKRDEYLIVQRRGESVRCANYCSVSKWCPYYSLIEVEI